MKTIPFQNKLRSWPTAWIFWTAYDLHFIISDVWYILHADYATYAWLVQYSPWLLRWQHWEKPLARALSQKSTVSQRKQFWARWTTVWLSMVVLHAHTEEREKRKSEESSDVTSLASFTLVCLQGNQLKPTKLPTGWVGFTALPTFTIKQPGVPWATTATASNSHSLCNELVHSFLHLFLW